MDANFTALTATYNALLAVDFAAISDAEANYLIVATGLVDHAAHTDDESEIDYALKYAAGALDRIAHS